MLKTVALIVIRHYAHLHINSENIVNVDCMLSLNVAIDIRQGLESVVPSTLWCVHVLTD